MRAMFALLLTALWLHLPTPTGAQSPPALVVALRDQAGHAVVGVTVLVRDQSGQRLLGEARTGLDGRATVEHVPVAEVRVAVRGEVEGVSLVQRGDDATGLLVFLDAPTVTVELRVDKEGIVVPDPSMFVLEQALASSTAVPTAPLAATPATSTAMPPVIAGVVPGASGGVSTPAPAPRGGSGFLGLLLILGLLAAIVRVLAYERRVP